MMVKVQVQRKNQLLRQQQNQKIKKNQSLKQKNSYQTIIIEGHARFDLHGQDIVCSAISAIVFGTLNALDAETKDSVFLEVTDNKIVINILSSNDVNQLILKTMLYQLKTIEKQYSKNLQIKET